MDVTVPTGGPGRVAMGVTVSRFEGVTRWV